MSTFTVTRVDYEENPQGVVQSTDVVQVTTGPRGLTGATGATGATGPAGPNLISDATALGTLTDVNTPAFLLVGNAAGTFARKLTHPSPSPAGTFTLASLTIDAFGRVTAASNGTLTSADISDSTATGRAVLTATDAAAARSAIGAGTGNALTSGTLGQFAATTSAELAGVLTDETGSGGGFVRATGPTLTTPSISGTLAVYQTGQSGASTARVDVSHDGTDTRVNSLSGRIRLIGGSGQGVVIQGAGGTIGGVLLLNSTNGALTVWDGWPLLHSASGRLGVQSTTVVGWPSTLDASASPVLGLARLDDNTVEVNNGTRTASGGALRGLSVSTLNIGASSPVQLTSTFGNLTVSGDVRAGLSLRANDGLILGASADVRLRRSSANVLDLDTGTNNAFADLRARNFTASGLTTLGTYTVATLPSASANAGAFAQVTDSNSTTNGNTVAGGGSNRVPVFSNGTNWIIK